MSWEDFLVIFVVCALTMFACRILPLFLLKGRELPERMKKALGFIPPAAFGALVANDIFKPGMFDGGIWPGIIPFIAAACVVFVAYKSKSLIASVIVGVGVYALLVYI